MLYRVSWGYLACSKGELYNRETRNTSFHLHEVFGIYYGTIMNQIDELNMKILLVFSDL